MCGRQTKAQDHDSDNRNCRETTKGRRRDRGLVTRQLEPVLDEADEPVGEPLEGARDRRLRLLTRANDTSSAVQRPRPLAALRVGRLGHAP